MPHRIKEMLPAEVLTKMHVPIKPTYPVLKPEHLTNYNMFIFSIPMHYGKCNFPTQWKTFRDATRQLWGASALHSKYVGMFISSGMSGSGQEVTALSTLLMLMCHGIIYLPLRYKHAFRQLVNLTEVHSGSLWDAGTFAVRSLPSSHHVCQH